jgi:osmoprotectant transport system substrate-binding protein
MNLRRLAAGLALAIAVGAFAGCGTDDKPAKPKLTVGASSIPESALVADIYAQALRNAGYDVAVRQGLGARRQVVWALEQGMIDLAPDYADDLRSQLTGRRPAVPAKTTEPEAVVSALLPALTQRKLIAYPPARAARTPAFAVAEATARAYKLRSLSDLASPDVAGKLTLGGPVACESSPSCLPVLRNTYAASFATVAALDDGGPRSITALKRGDVQLALVYRSDPAVGANKLVLLDDDRKAMPANNLLPVLRLGAASLRIQGILQKVNQVLTTDDLVKLRRAGDAAGGRRDEVVSDFLNDVPH